MQNLNKPELLRRCTTCLKATTTPESRRKHIFMPLRKIDALKGVYEAYRGSSRMTVFNKDTIKATETP